MVKQTPATVALDVPQAYLDLLKEYAWEKVTDEKKNNLSADLTKYLYNSEKIPYKPTGWEPNPKIKYPALKVSRSVLDHCPHLIDVANCFDWQYFDAKKISGLIASARFYLMTLGIPKK